MSTKQEKEKDATPTATTAAPDLSKAVFVDGERVLCFHSGLLYEAKVLKVEYRQAVEDFFYLIHYQGWSKKWDEFIQQEYVLKYNDANLERQRDLKRNAEEERRGTKRGGAAVKISLGKKGRGGPKKSLTGDANTSNVSMSEGHSNSNSRASTPVSELKVEKDVTLMPKLEVQESDKEVDNSEEAVKMELGEIDQSVKPTSMVAVENTTNVNVNEKSIVEKTSNTDASSASEVGSSTHSSQELQISDKKTTKKPSRYFEMGEIDYQYEIKQEIQIELPTPLKEILVDDSDMINNHLKLVKLPAKFTVDKILQDYLSDEGENLDQSAAQLCAGIKDYFELMLGSNLLYKYERIQYTNFLNGQHEHGNSVLKYYGGIHLLRLFSKIGDLLSYGTFERFAIEVLQSNITKLFNFLVKNVKTYFNNQDDYLTSEPDYQRKVPPTY